MKILVTGGMGGIGSFVTKKLVEEGHDIVVFDLKTKKNEIFAKKNPYFTPYFGDLRNYEDIRGAVKNVDFVIHMAFVLQPLSEIDKKYSREVNVGGTIKLFKAINEENPNIKLIFISSTTIYGITKDEKPPIKLNHKIKPVVDYSKHKVECEKIVKQLIKNFVILRFSEVGHFQISGSDFEYMYRLPCDQRTEFLHAEDAATAVVNSVKKFNKINGETFIISGGKQNQVKHYERLKIVLGEAYGLTPPPKSKFTKKPYPFDWYESDRSQKILKYQNKSIYDFAQDYKKILPYNPKMVKFFAPIVEFIIYNRYLAPIYRLIFNYYYQHNKEKNKLTE